MTVANLHAKNFPDHRIAAKLRMSLGDVVRERRALNLTAHPAESRLTIDQVHVQFAKWSGYIWKVARRWKRVYPALDLDDLHAEAMAGFLRAGEHYDPRRTNPKTGNPYAFTSYADHWMRKYVQLFVKRELVARSVVSFATLSDDGENGWEPSVEEDEGSAARRWMYDNADWWERRTGGLTDLERELVILRFRRGMTWDQIEWSMCKEVSRERLPAVVAGAVAKMRAAGDMD